MGFYESTGIHKSELLYKDEHNIMLRWSKKSLLWIFENMPDFSFVFGFKRRLANWLFIAVYLYIMGDFFFFSFDLATFLIRGIIVGIAASIFFSKIFSWTIYMALLKWQEKAKEKFEGENR